MAQMNSTVGDFEGNFEKMAQILRSAEGADLVIFPECALCGYPAQDLLDYSAFTKKSEEYAARLIQEFSNRSFIFGSVGTNAGTGRPCQNIAIFADRGKLLAKYAKRLLPSYDVFDEDRFFEPGRTSCLVDFKGAKIALTICEDIWSDDSGTPLQNRYHQNPVSDSQEADFLINISASPYEQTKVEPKREMLKRIAERNKTTLIYVNAVGANDALIFDGRTYVFSRQGEVLIEGLPYVEAQIEFDDRDSKPRKFSTIVRDADVYDALILGLRDYCQKQNFKSVVLGLSGGIDSSLVACLAADAIGKENVAGVMMPSRFTSKASNDDALSLARTMYNPLHVYIIEDVYGAALRTLQKAFENTTPNIAEENLQARTRGMLLMGLSNKFGHLVLTTGNKSEIAVGYCTLYGDMCGGLAPIADVYKTQVYELSREANRRWQRIPENVFTKAPTAELRADQTDQDTLPPYERLDQILSLAVESCRSENEIVAKGFDREEVQRIFKWISSSEHKRYQMSLGLKISSKAFGIGRRVPIVQKFY